MATSTIKSNAWKLVGNTSGTTSLALPANFSELLVVVTAVDAVVTSVIPREALKSASQYFIIGGGYNSSSYPGYYANTSISLTSYSLTRVMINNNTRTSDSSSSVYYR